MHAVKVNLDLGIFFLKPERIGVSDVGAGRSEHNHLTLFFARADDFFPGRIINRRAVRDGRADKHKHDQNSGYQSLSTCASRSSWVEANGSKNSIDGVMRLNPILQYSNTPFVKTACPYCRYVTGGMRQGTPVFASSAS